VVRVALVGPVYPYRGGIAHYTTMLARSLAERHETLVISFRRQYPNWLYPGKTDRDPSREPLRAEAEYLLDPLYPWTWWRTANRIASFGPDVVVLQWWTTFWAPAFGALSWLLRRRGLKVVFLIHNVLPHEERAWDASLARLTLRVARDFIVQTEEEKRRLSWLLPNLPAESVTVCAHPLYGMFAEKSIPAHQARHALELPVDVPVLLFFGIVRPYKGLKCLLEAMGLLRNRGRLVHLVVAGEFWEDKSTYLAFLAEHDLSEVVTIVDRYIANEDVPLYFSACDVVVLPYQRTTQSGVVALAHGFSKPVIGSGLNGQMAAADSRHRLILVPPADCVALANAIDDFLDCAPPREQDLTAALASNGERDWGCLVQAVEAAGCMA
jgi:glycosyltransferase involved in cell wall biosynthesis